MVSHAFERTVSVRRAAGSRRQRKPSGMSRRRWERRVYADCRAAEVYSRRRGPAWDLPGYRPND